MNRLLVGDNLQPKQSGNAVVSLPPQWLTNKNVFPDASVDLEYLDPPFNSNANVRGVRLARRRGRDVRSTRWLGHFMHVLVLHGA